MKTEHKNIILKYVKKFAANKRKPKYTAEYYLDNILHLINDFNSWETLKKSNTLSKDSKKYHYKTIADIHRLWSKLGVYSEAFKEIINKNINFVEDDKKSFDIMIDSTLIVNKNGSDNVGFGGSACRKKKFSKLTAICNEEGKLVNIIPNITYEKEIPTYCDKLKLNSTTKVKRKIGRPRKGEEVSKPKPVSETRKDKIRTLEHDIKGIDEPL